MPSNYSGAKAEAWCLLIPADASLSLSLSLPTNYTSHFEPSCLESSANLLLGKHNPSGPGRGERDDDDHQAASREPTAAAAAGSSA